MSFELIVSPRISAFTVEIVVSFSTSFFLHEVKEIININIQIFF